MDVGGALRRQLSGSPAGSVGAIFAVAMFRNTECIFAIWYFTMFGTAIIGPINNHAND
ncbi:MAG: hypothetical protein ACKVQU_14820 [Burkholderiales bacterium]